MQTMRKAAQDRENAGVGSRLREAADAAKKAADMKAGPKPDSPRAVEAVMKGRLEQGGPLGKEGGEGDNGGEYSAIHDLAGILRRSPSMFSFPLLATRLPEANAQLSSNHLLKNLLPTLTRRKEPLPALLQDRAGALRR